MAHDPRSAPDPGDALQEAHALAAAGEHARALALLRTQRAGPAGVPAASLAQALAALARSAERAGDLSAARGALESALEHVDWADLQFALGRLCLREGERGAARRAFERALALNPRYRAAAVERALLDARDGRIADAVAALHALAGEVSPREGEALRAGLERLREAELDDAAIVLREGLAGGDEALETLVAEARARLAAGEPGAGLAALRRAVAERPAWADLHALLGAHELRAGHLDDGIASLARALELNPDFHAARLELARGLEARGEHDGAVRMVRQVLDADPSDAAAAGFYERLTAPRQARATARP